MVIRRKTKVPTSESKSVHVHHSLREPPALLVVLNRSSHVQYFPCKLYEHLYVLKTACAGCFLELPENVILPVLGRRDGRSGGSKRNTQAPLSQSTMRSVVGQRRTGFVSSVFFFILRGADLIFHENSVMNC